MPREIPPEFVIAPDGDSIAELRKRASRHSIALPAWHREGSWQRRNPQSPHRITITTGITFAPVVARSSGAGHPGGRRWEGRSSWSCSQLPCFSACTWCGRGWSRSISSSPLFHYASVPPAILDRLGTFEELRQTGDLQQFLQAVSQVTQLKAAAGAAGGDIQSHQRS